MNFVLIPNAFSIMLLDNNNQTEQIDDKICSSIELPMDPISRKLLIDPISKDSSWKQSLNQIAQSLNSSEWCSDIRKPKINQTHTNLSTCSDNSMACSSSVDYVSKINAMLSCENLKSSQNLVPFSHKTYYGRTDIIGSPCCASGKEFNKAGNDSDCSSFTTMIGTPQLSASAEHIHTENFNRSDEDLTRKPKSKYLEMISECSYECKYYVNPKSNRKNRVLVWKFPGCNREFTKTWGLKEHYRVHSKEKPFECHKWGTRFTQKGSLLKHIKKSKSRTCKP